MYGIHVFVGVDEKLQKNDLNIRCTCTLEVGSFEKGKRGEKTYFRKGCLWSWVWMTKNYKNNLLSIIHTNSLEYFKK